MTPISIDRLQNAVINPGLEKHLKPLLAYRGAVTLGRAHRLLNLTVSAMEQDCNFSDITQRLQMNPDFSHLCGPDKKAQYMGLCGFFARLESNPDVTNNVPHLLDYVRSLGGFRPILTPVSYDSSRKRNLGAGGWRNFVSSVRSVETLKAPREQLVYPFLIHDAGRPEHDLLRKVTAAVPKYLNPDLRADICQDLIVGILCGDFSEDDLKLPAKEMTRKVSKMFPDKYGPLSLDAEIPGTDGMRLIDTLSDEFNPWEMAI